MSRNYELGRDYNPLDGEKFTISIGEYIIVEMKTINGVRYGYSEKFNTYYAYDVADSYAKYSDTIKGYWVLKADKTNEDILNEQESEENFMERFITQPKYTNLFI